MKRFICITVAIVLVTLFFIQQRKLKSFKRQSQLQGIELSILKDSVNVIRNKNGELSYQVQSVEIEKQDLKDALEIAGYDIQSLKEREIQYRKINSILKAQLEATGQGNTIIRDTIRVINEKDTINYQVMAPWSNGFLSLFDATIEFRNLDFSYRYETGINVIQEHKKKQTLITISLTDPNASITSAASFNVMHHKKWYEKPWIWGLAGVATGIIIAN